MAVKVPDPTIADPWVVAMQENAKLPHALMGGTKRMVAAREEFLPKNQRESKDDY